MSDGVVVTLVFSFKPGGADQFAQIMPTMFKDTMERKGFRAIKALRNQDNPEQIIFIEEWDSTEDYRAYVAWRTSRGEGLDSIGEALSAPPELYIWDQRIA
jgi:quinol monooxygenase YgiN